MNTRNQPVERIFFTFNETMLFLNSSRQTIYNLMEMGLPSHKIGKKRVFIPEDIKEKMLKKQKVRVKSKKKSQKISEY